MSRPRVAVIGTGVAGMAAAWFLKDDCDVVFFEKNTRPGGHTHTVTVDEEGTPVHVDTGFMVYNDVTYPNLLKFFLKLRIPAKTTSMSFSVQHRPSGLEYCGTGLSGLFSPRRNLFNLRYWRMLLDIDRFNRTSVEVLEGDRYARHTMEEYARAKGYGPDLLDRYLLPMSSAIWSTPPDKMLNFPAVTLVRFFKNHGLLGLTTHYQWKTVEGGSRVYRDKVLAAFPGAVRLGCGAAKVARRDGAVFVHDTAGGEHRFDKAVIAAHADEALAAIEGPTAMERALLSCFRYEKNRAMLHTDESVMPKTRAAWSSWNYRVEKDGQASVIYWMNSLQGVSKKRNYFVSINDRGRVSPSKVLWEDVYEHPIYDRPAVEAQAELPHLNRGPVYFCGSYFNYGFHEDAFTSGLRAAEAVLGREIVW